MPEVTKIWLLLTVLIAFSDQNDNLFIADCFVCQARTLKGAATQTKQSAVYLVLKITHKKTPGHGIINLICVGDIFDAVSLHSNSSFGSCHSPH